jgi:hypothetical protein
MEPISSYPHPSEVTQKELLSKEVAIGAITTVAGIFLFKDKSIYVAGINVPGSVAMGVDATACSLSADLAHKYLIPHPGNPKIQKGRVCSYLWCSFGLTILLAT